MKIQVYTDGSCIGNPGRGGWAFLVFDVGLKKVVFEESGSERQTTNNRMEMMAIIKALKYLAENDVKNAEIFCDSRLVVNTINLGWKKKANTDLWVEMLSLFSKVEVKVSWVKAHSTNALNNRVDELARRASG